MRIVDDEDVCPTRRFYARCAVLEGGVDRPRAQHEARIATAANGLNVTVDRIMTTSQGGLGRALDLWKSAIGGMEGGAQSNRA